MQAWTRTRNRNSSTLRRLPLTAAIYLTFGSMAWAQSAPEQPPPSTSTAPATTATAPTTSQPPSNKTATLDTITVTAQKRTENLQKVPISIQVLGETKLKQQDVMDFDDYAKLVPSLSYGAIGGGVFSGPGFAQVYMRGVASGGDGNHSGPQPSVGMYLDEQPITTIQGSLDIHIYDVARIEALAGPQGTLYGASSEAGTVRIITNKPDPSGYSSGYAVEASAIDGGGIGHVVEGFVNAPLSPAAAIRLVGWQKRDAGYIDNVHGTRTFPTSGVTMDNAALVDDNYNWANTTGARAALKIDLNDNWSITPTIIAQRQKANGSSAYEPVIGDLQLHHYFPERSDDRWTQASMTLQGKIGDFDLNYTYAHLNRDVDSDADYSDYFWYDQLVQYGQYFCSQVNPDFTCTPGTFVPPAQRIHAKDSYTKTSNEIRLTSPQDNRWRFVAGLFWQQQGHGIFQNYQVDGLAPELSVTGYPGTIWLTAQQRTDKDEAAFGELSFDITPTLTATAGGRFFRTRNSLVGYFGYGPNFAFGGSTGESQCFSDDPFHGAPCVNLDKSTRESGSLGRFNLTWQASDTKMLYATWSEGFRPGGINRRGTVPPYKSDFLTNYEAGWKTSWADNRLTWNGAVFQENWKDFQFSYLGANGLTEIRNAAQARIRGLETDVRWAATYNLAITAGAAFYDSKLTKDYCGALSPITGEAITDCPVGSTVDGVEFENGPQAPAGTRLPVTARFKGNLTARYSFDLWGGQAFWQAAVIHQGSRRVDLRVIQNDKVGDLDPYTLADLSVGFNRNNWSVDVFLKNAFNNRAELARFTECKIETCGDEPYTVVTQPRTIGVRFTQDF
jgi:iron complex outermembrane recepter protein